MNVQTNSAMWDIDVTFDAEIMAAIKFNTKITDTQTNTPTAMCIRVHTHTLVRFSKH